MNRIVGCPMIQSLQNSTPGFAEAPPKINSDMAWESRHIKRRATQESQELLKPARPKSALVSFVAILSGENINLSARGNQVSTTVTSTRSTR